MNRYSRDEDEERPVAWWQKLEFWLVVSVLVIMIVIVFSRFPNAEAIWHQITRWAISALHLGLLFLGAFFAGMFCRRCILWIDKRLRPKDMTEKERGTLAWLCAVVISGIQGLSMPWLVDDHAVLGLFGLLRWGTTWEILPWGWMSYSFLACLAGYYFARMSQGSETTY